MDLDSNLARLAAAPLPDLAALDGSALAAQARAEVAAAQRTGGLALVAALTIGLAGGLQTPAEDAAPLAAFGPPPALTPLLGLAKG